MAFMTTRGQSRTFWIAFFGLMFALAGGVVLYVYQALQPLPAAPLAGEALQSQPGLQVERTEWGYLLIPNKPKAGLAFYPGARVDFTAYAPVLRPIAEQGYVVALLQAPFGLAITRPALAQPALERFPDLPWVLGGHSLGGVAASSYVSQGANVKGLIFFASYPQVSLADQKLPSLALFGSRDGLINPEEARNESSKYPVGTQIIFIEGLNHAGFGAYGPQPGDLEATLTKEAGWLEIQRPILTFMKQFDLP